MKINYLIVLAIITMSVSCQSPNRVNDKSDELIHTLSAIQEQGTLFGHQDDLAFGKNWQYLDGESDVKRVSGDYPAVYGWELGGIERGDLFNLDSVPFQNMTELAIKAHEMGGINSFSWHPYSLVNGENSW
ncbi:MAG: hypothetical protein PF444_09430 [Bacteroidales bacterium]|jgi:mannan endo-1,4-beta-mannosidase|nr:hypothetical protein [Bacteroidales bacterium]